MQLTDDQTRSAIAAAWNELQSVPSYVERHKNLIEKYHQRFCEERCKPGEGEYSVLYQTWKSLESDDPAGALRGWIEKTQERIQAFEAMQAEGLVKLTDKKGNIIRTCQPDERSPMLEYFDHKLAVFTQALQEYSALT